MERHTARSSTIILVLAIALTLSMPFQITAAQQGKVQSKRNKLIPEVAKKDSICFAIYTVHAGILKMTVQLYPLEKEDSRGITLQIKQAGTWTELAKARIRESLYTLPSPNTKAWNALFRVENWDHGKDWQYRVVALDGIATYSGTIRRDPIDKHEIVIAAFTGNSNGDRRLKPDIISNIQTQNPDLLFFSGDQSYDHRNHLGAWLLFGRQFGEIIKDRPTICIPDDHDIGQGNLWGAEGKKSTGAGGFADGGYGLPVAYVNEVQFAQTANLPDPYDARPIQRNISVYYTSLNVGAVDFAIIEDRKFKSGPMGLVEAPGHKRPDLINDEHYDRASVDVPGAKLLGDRQLTFLRDWGTQWDGVQMKAVLSQTVFVNAAHKTGPWRVVADLDSNGWPQTGRNKALKEIRKAFAFMIAGDQHLGTVIHHGVDEWRDAGFSFCVPSIVNYWPRSWLPIEAGLNPVHERLEHTGDYHDGFGNKLTMYAYSNPRGATGEIGTRDDPFAGGAAGYGIVRFNKTTRHITIECWPRNVDISAPDAQQYPGWPVTVSQQDNYGRKAVAYLPTLHIRGQSAPVVQVIDEANNAIVYTLRIKGDSFRPKVFHAGSYTLKLGQGKNMITLKSIKSLRPTQQKSIHLDL
jgi:hypothetical protein